MAVTASTAAPFVQARNGGLSVTAYRGVGRVLLAFDLDPSLANNLAGFAVQALSQVGPPYYVRNRLNFAPGVLASVGGRSVQFEGNEWTPSDVAPFQRFRVTDVPDGPVAGYEVTAMYFAGQGLSRGATVSLPLNLESTSRAEVSLGFNRSFLSAEAFFERFSNRSLRPIPPSIDVDTSSFADLYEWLGAEARRLTIDFITSANQDPDVSVDAFIYDIDEPDIVRSLAALGPRLRVIMDDSPFHGPESLEDRVRKRFRERGANVRDGHFNGLSHSKVLIERRHGTPTRVLTGSANFTFQSLYVKPNCVVVIDNPSIAARYAQAFDQAFTNIVGFASSPVAKEWFDFEAQDRTLSLCFAPHPSAAVSLERLSAAIRGAGSSVLFSLHEAALQEDVLAALQEATADQRLFTRGVVRSAPGASLYYASGPLSSSVDDNTALTRIPEQFRDGHGPWQPLHQSFVVIDFNSDEPIVFAGSSNYGQMNETRNGENLFAIRDPTVATAFAVEALRLCDWFEFDIRVREGRPTLQGPGEREPWWQTFFDETVPIFHERRLLAAGRGSRVRQANLTRLAGYQSDSEAGVDQLGFDREVSALCTVIAARDVTPPLSVGLFGDWGTGKSFFMGMMERRIDELARLSREADARGRPSDFCRNVRQIRFNAWHYVDANLWASLVSEIFGELAAAKPGDLQERMGELTSSLMLRKEKEAEQAAVHQEKESIENGLQQVQHQRQTLKNLWLSTEAGIAATAALAQDPEVQKRVNEFNQKSPGGPATAEDLKDEARDLSTAWGKLNRLWAVLRRSSHRALLVTFLVGLVVVVVGFFLATRFSAVAPVSLLLSAAIAGAGLVKDLKEPIATVRALSLAADAGAQRLSQLESAARNQREQELQGQLQALADREKRLNDDAARIAQREAELQKEIDDIEHGRRIVSFIQQRALSTDYTQKLGVVALIRNDFERLSQLLAEANQAVRAGQSSGASVERIILYIDDLDRCPARLVVNVLEAVHLLLAFELFVVVVGVDSRWLLQSLRQHYALQLGTPENEGELKELTSVEATPQNFLEKIFQIPFCVKPMGKDGFGRLVTSLFPTAPQPEQRVPAPVPTPPASESPAQAEPPATRQVPQPGAAPAAAPGEEGVHFAPARQPIPWGPAVDLQPAALQVSPREVTFMKELSELVPTPRATKRLANTYRLIRASMEPTELAAFEAENNNEYQVVLILLGVLIGFSDQAPIVFSELLTEKGGNWWQFVEHLASPAVSVDMDGSRSRDDTEALSRLIRCLNNLREKTALPGDLEAFQNWAPRIARYSFRVNWEVLPRPEEMPQVRAKPISSARRSTARSRRP